MLEQEGVSMAPEIHKAIVLTVEHLADIATRVPLIIAEIDEDAKEILVRGKCIRGLFFNELSEVGDPSDVVIGTFGMERYFKRLKVHKSYRLKNASFYAVVQTFIYVWRSFV